MRDLKPMQLDGFMFRQRETHVLAIRIYHVRGVVKRCEECKIVYLRTQSELTQTFRVIVPGASRRRNFR